MRQQQHLGALEGADDGLARRLGPGIEQGQTLRVERGDSFVRVLARLRERYRTAVRGQAGSHDVASAAGSPANAAASTPQNADHWLVFVDGRFAPALSAIGGLPGGAQIGSLADALKQTPEAVEAAFGNASDGETPQALNAALVTDGAWIRLGRGVAVEQPIHLVFVGATTADRHLRNLVVADAGAQATIVEHYPAGAAGSTLTTAVTRILAAQDSHIVHLKLQEEAPEAIHLATIEAEQARGAVFASHSLSFGARSLVT